MRSSPAAPPETSSRRQNRQAAPRIGSSHRGRVRRCGLERVRSPAVPLPLNGLQDARLSCLPGVRDGLGQALLNDGILVAVNILALVVCSAISVSASSSFVRLSSEARELERAGDSFCARLLRAPAQAGLFAAALPLLNRRGAFQRGEVASTSPHTKFLKQGLSARGELVPKFATCVGPGNALSAVFSPAASACAGIVAGFARLILPLRFLIAASCSSAFSMRSSSRSRSAVGRAGRRRLRRMRFRTAERAGLSSSARAEILELRDLRGAFSPTRRPVGAHSQRSRFSATGPAPPPAEKWRRAPFRASVLRLYSGVERLGRLP